MERFQKIAELESKISRLYELSDDHHDAFTPFALCEDVIMQIPSLKGSILVINNLEFLSVLRERGIDMSNVSYATICDKKAIGAQMLGVEKSNIIQYDYNKLDEFPNMKFDVVISNPPYQASKKNSSSLWPLFVRLAYSLSNRYVAMIIPNRWGTNTPNIQKGKIKLLGDVIGNTLVVANIGECSRHFDAGMGKDYFSYFVGDVDKNDSSFRVISRAGVFDVDNIGILPIIDPSAIDLSIFGKVEKFKKGKDKFDVTLTQNRKSGKWKKVFCLPDYKIFVMGFARWMPYLKMPRAIVDRTYKGDLMTLFYSISIPQNSTEQSVLSVFNSPLFAYLVDKMTFANVTKGIIEILPYFDPSRVWSNKEIYSEIGLNDEEIKYIEGMFK